MSTFRVAGRGVLLLKGDFLLFLDLREELERGESLTDFLIGELKFKA